MNPHFTAAAVIAFWTEAGPGRWFKKDSAFDDAFRAQFAAEHEAAASGALDAWSETADGALALLILLDQYPRNSFRGTARMFATDGKALAVAKLAVELGFDTAVEPSLRSCFYIPFEQSALQENQDRALQLFAALGDEAQRYAVIHRDIIARFGRFPHRNALLGRATSTEEEQFLVQGGFAG
jgi:uncharacterized protein (DUF924 family)